MTNLLGTYGRYIAFALAMMAFGAAGAPAQAAATVWGDGDEALSQLTDKTLARPQADAPIVSQQDPVAGFEYALDAAGPNNATVDESAEPEAGRLQTQSRTKRPLQARAKTERRL